MKYSNGLRRKLESVLYTNHNNFKTYYNSYSIKLDDHNIYKYFISFPLELDKDNCIIYPSLIKYESEVAIYDKYFNNENKIDCANIVFPLVEEHTIEDLVTEEAVFRSIFDYGYYRGLTMVHSRDFGKFFGGTGLITDENFNPLLIHCIKVQKENDHFKYINPITYISNRVYREEDNKFCKFLIKKVIPFYTKFTNKYLTPVILNFDNHMYGEPEVIIKNLDNLVKKVPIPSFPKIEEDVKGTLQYCKKEIANSLFGIETLV